MEGKRNSCGDKKIKNIEISEKHLNTTAGIWRQQGQQECVDYSRYFRQTAENNLSKLMKLQKCKFLLLLDQYIAQPSDTDSLENVKIVRVLFFANGTSQLQLSDLRVVIKNLKVHYRKLLIQLRSSGLRRSSRSFAIENKCSPSDEYIFIDLVSSKEQKD